MTWRDTDTPAADWIKWDDWLLYNPLGFWSDTQRWVDRQLWYDGPADSWIDTTTHTGGWTDA